MTVKVKICGNAREEDLRVAASAGADAVGFIFGFPTSPRNLEIGRVADLVRRAPATVDSVIVTNTESLQTNQKRIKDVNPDAIQLYGRPENAVELSKDMGVRLIKAVRVSPTRVPDWRGDLAGYQSVLVDSYTKDSHGGSGVVADWDLCAKIRAQIAPQPLILSGGLKPENVREAIRRVRPYGVDVSSGVEASPGVKDSRKVLEFISTAKEATL